MLDEHLLPRVFDEKVISRWKIPAKPPTSTPPPGRFASIPSYRTRADTIPKISRGGAESLVGKRHFPVASGKLPA